ncbi:uncharacterized protein LOC132043503, partial [Lycium ferocissimum]|uniref:uncharacterized protein LOC132043503 n=1 Tax=Lycium ferocissimum TaxID=112874 RepID=UPI002814DDC6
MALLLREFVRMTTEMIAMRADVGSINVRLANVEQTRYEDRGGQDRNLHTIKVELPKFKGGSDPEEFLEWKLQSERIFLTNNISNVLKAKHDLTQFEGYASTWLESKKRKRAQWHIYDVPTWQELIELMEARYVTPDYYQGVIKRVYMLRQGSKSVEEYFDEFENLRLKSKIEEHLNYTVIRFVANLNHDISKPMRPHFYTTLEEAFHDATKVEADLKAEKSYKAKNVSSLSWSKNRWEKAKITTPTPQAKFDYKAKGEDKAKGGNNAKHNLSHPSTIQCFKCQGRGHIASECPNRRAIVVMLDGYRTDGEEEGGGGGSDGEPKGEHEREFEEEDDERQLEDNINLACVLRRIMGAMNREELDQRENLFHTRCKIMDKVCFSIIDGGSCTNVVSMTLVDHMKFPTRKHPSPYKLQWFNDYGEVRVTKRVVVKFSIGKYQDEVLCDVVPMQACHMLLGRPWQFDRDAQHSGRSNKYSLVFGGRKHTLTPLTPDQVSKDYRIMKELRKRVQNEEVEKESLLSQEGQE